jgi:excisionase family DNA binding protein
MAETARVAWTIRDWAEAVSCSKVHVHRLIRDGKIETRKMGRKRLILTSPEPYVKSLDGDYETNPAVHQIAQRKIRQPPPGGGRKASPLPPGNALCA